MKRSAAGRASPGRRPPAEFSAKKVVIAGAGAMGTLFAALLSRRRGLRVILSAKNSSAAGRIKRLSIEVSGKTRLAVPRSRIKIISPRDLRRKNLPPADLALILVKSFDTESAARDIAPLVGPETAVVTFQNGLGNTEIIRRTFKNLRVRASGVFSGSTTHGAMLIRPGRVFHSGAGKSLIAYDKTSEKSAVSAAADILSSAGLNVRATKGSASLLWSKLVVNAAINPVGAVFSQTNGEILRNDFALKIALRSATEAAAVCRAGKIRLLYPSASRKVKEVLAATASNKNSMLRDVLSGRPTEIDAITGSVLRAAAAAGIKTPCNLTLYNSVKISGKLKI